jgi:hypothetical protein
MRFYTNQHRYYCRIDLHVRSMHVCVLDSQDEILLHRKMSCHRESYLKANFPYKALPHASGKPEAVLGCARKLADDFLETEPLWTS